MMMEKERQTVLAENARCRECRCGLHKIRGKLWSAARRTVQAAAAAVASFSYFLPMFFSFDAVPRYVDAS
jgi:hypothetical protein